MPPYFFEFTNKYKSITLGPLRSKSGSLLTTPQAEIKRSPQYIREHSTLAQRFLDGLRDE
jgi:hypothetical protein